MRNFCLAALIAAAGCSNDPLPPSDVQLLVGQETETWSAEPAPTRVRVEVVTDTQRKVIAETNAPASVITVGDPQVAYGTVATFEASGIDAAGTPVVRGQSVPYLIYGFSNAKIPLFIARTSMWSRPPEKLAHARSAPVLAIAGSQFIIAAGGEAADVNPATPEVYDTINWKVMGNQTPLPRSPKTMVIAGRGLLSIDDAGATWIDLDGYEKPEEPAPPAGLTWGEVAGGQVAELPDGSSFIVGATRLTGEPTAKVLRVDRYGFLRAIPLSTPRRGAAAGVVAGKLIVWGGSTEGAGAEVLNKAQDAFAALPYPPDPTSGLALATLDGNTAVLAGGKDAMTSAAVPMRTFDVTCAADCATAELAALPLALQRTRVLSYVGGHLFVTGDSEDGEFHAFSVLTASGTPEVVERPLRERRKGASSILLPNGQPAVLGGHHPETMEAVLNLETFFL